MATYHILCSTDENPRHEYCPSGADSWCQWQKAQAIGSEFKHPAPLHEDVQKHILPIYEDLLRLDLLERCLGGHTQNANESFNSTVWRFCPKHLHSGLKIVESATFIAAGLFNEGYSAIFQIMMALKLIIGRQCKMYGDNVDEWRVPRQERRSISSSKEARRAKKQQALEENMLYEEVEGLLYGLGITD
ncbi:PREDICTED: uncharacterized protein LOC108761572 [Trachymyrmex cornetzi]|nr:PREDICTED: uncharacterized protein LOC108761572 [Trachymyrmex cornetzi]